MSSQLILAIDIAASYTRAALFDTQGNRIAQTVTQQTYPLVLGGDGAAELEPAALLGAVRQCLEDAAALRKELGEKTVHARTGCMLRASFWPAKMAWLRRTDPKLVARVKQWMSPAEWLQLILIGDANCAMAMATGTGLFNPVKLNWDAGLLKRAGLSPELLRPLS